VSFGQILVSIVFSMEVEQSRKKFMEAIARGISPGNSFLSFTINLKKDILISFSETTCDPKMIDNIF
jgi:hypothetical protein